MSTMDNTARRTEWTLNFLGLVIESAAAVADGYLTSSPLTGSPSSSSRVSLWQLGFDGLRSVCRVDR